MHHDPLLHGDVSELLRPLLQDALVRVSKKDMEESLKPHEELCCGSMSIGM